MPVRRFLLIVAVALAGCGGSEGETPPAGPADGSLAYATELDAICADWDDAEAPMRPEDTDLIRTEEFGDPQFLEAFAEVGAEHLERVRALTPPAGDRANVEAMTAAMDRMLAALRDRGSGLRRGEPVDDTEDEYVTGYTDLAAAAGPLGVTRCQGVIY